MKRNKLSSNDSIIFKHIKELKETKDTTDLANQLGTTWTKIVRSRGILKYGSSELINAVLNDEIGIHMAYLSLDNIPKRQSKRNPPYSEVVKLVKIDLTSPTGLVWATTRHWAGCGVGCVAGSFTSSAPSVSLNGIPHCVSRVAWLLLNGDWPPENMFVLYLDGNITNHTKENVVLKTRQQLYRSGKKHAKNYHENKQGSFEVWLRNPKTQIGEHFGTYPTEKQAKKRASTIRNRFKKLYPEYY